MSHRTVVSSSESVDLSSGVGPRVVVTGASGNVGVGVLRALAQQIPNVELVGICRRPPRCGGTFDNVEWYTIDLATADAEQALAPAMHGADVVIHLALAIHPTGDAEYLFRANVLGSEAVFNAMRTAGVGHLIYASSLSVYAPSPEAPVDENWPKTGQMSSTYSRNKVLVEQLLDRIADAWPDITQARLLPTVVVQREAAWLFRHLYLGRFTPRWAIRLLRTGALPIIPLPAGLQLQCVHADDVGDAVVKLITTRAQGSFNVAADVLDGAAIAALCNARPLYVSPDLMRRAVLMLRRMRLIAVTPGWYDVATRSPIMKTDRAASELGWAPRWSSSFSALELIDGLAEGVSGPTPATGSREGNRMNDKTRRAHDVTLGLWAVLAVLRAARFGRPGKVDAAVIGTHLIAGTPLAIDRVRSRRRDPVALLAPVSVACALVASTRGSWTSVGCVAALGALAAADHRRTSAGLP